MAMDDEAMSGGPFNYLCTQQKLDCESLMAMASDLESRGMEGAASATRSFIPSEPSQELRDLWRAVEWHRANDWSEADVARAFVKWEASRK